MINEILSTHIADEIIPVHCCLDSTCSKQSRMLVVMRKGHVYPYFCLILTSISSLLLSHPYFYLILTSISSLLLSHPSISSLLLSHPYFYLILTSISSLLLSHPYFYLILTSISSLLLSHPSQQTIDTQSLKWFQ